LCAYEEDDENGQYSLSSPFFHIPKTTTTTIIIIIIINTNYTTLYYSCEEFSTPASVLLDINEEFRIRKFFLEFTSALLIRTAFGVYVVSNAPMQC